MQVLANVEPLPASCLGTSVPSSNLEELGKCECSMLDEFSTSIDEFSAVNIDDFIVPCNDGTLTCSNFEEQFVITAMADCANDCWHDLGFGRCAHALYVETANVYLECSLDIWENWLDATSPSNMECSDMWEKWLDAISQSQAPNNDASSSGCKPNTSPACFSGNISMPSLLDTNALFIESLPVYSNTYQHDSHPLDYTNNHVNDHLDINMSIHDNAKNSVGVSFPPSVADGNVPMTYSGSGDDYFDDVSSLFAAIASMSPHELFFASTKSDPPLPNLEARMIHSQLNLEATFSPPLSQNFKAAYNMNETRAIQNSGNCDGREIESFLVESCTAAIEDGYKWCKYGQKNIKGDKMHPRCYFKCAQRNCPVKKQTEDSSDMPGFVLITYFGKHNHYQT